MDEDGSRNVEVITLARAVASPYILNAGDVEQREYAKLYAVNEWIKRNIAFVMDPHDGKRHTELLSDTENILRYRAADCDEHVILAGAMLRALGFRSRVKGVDGRLHDQIEIWVSGPFDPSAKQHVPAHVYILAWTLGGNPYIVDTTLTDKPFGARAGDDTWKHWHVRF